MKKNITRLSIALFSLGILLTGCTQNDNFIAATTPPNMDNMTYLQRIQERTLLIRTVLWDTIIKDYPGVTEYHFRYQNNTKDTVQVHFMEFDLSNTDLSLSVGLPNDNNALPTSAQLQRLDTIVKYRNAKNPDKMVVGAINGGIYSGVTPEGYLVKDGVILKTTSNAYTNYIGLRKDGTLYLGDAATFAADKNNLQQAMNGRPLVAAGVAASQSDGTVTPRTAIGINGKKVIFFTVDGGAINAHISVGMKLRDMAAEMMAVGATDALFNFGASQSVMIARDPSGNYVLRNTPATATGAPNTTVDGWMVSIKK